MLLLEYVFYYKYNYSLGKPISSRLQQLVDSVAVDQLSTQATQLKQNIHSSSTLQKIQPNTSASYNGLQHVRLYVLYVALTLHVCTCTVCTCMTDINIVLHVHE